MNSSPDDQPNGPRRPLRLRKPSENVSDDNPLAGLSFQPKRADAIWTRSQWTALCEHLHNGNERTHFVMGFRGDDGCKKYVRSKRLPVDRAISWSWSSMTGTPKSKLAFVPYAQNDLQQSRWGGMDFDAHQEGQADRARQLAFAAFRCLLNKPDLSIILESSGSGGWHVWAITAQFQETRYWVQLLKSVARTIGVTITSGVCEIFPADSLPSKFGRGMRAPGCWNPGTDTFSEIYWENTHTSLGIVLSGKSKNAPLSVKDLGLGFPDIERNNSFFPSSPSYPLVPYNWNRWQHEFAITQASTRNAKLSALTGEMFHQVGSAMAHLLVETQWQTKTVTPRITHPKHMGEFESLWAGMVKSWRATLSQVELEKFSQLETENERDAFRIIRSYALKAKSDRAADFPIVRDNLAARLGITGNGAAGIRDKLVRLGIITKTANFVANKSAARFKWNLESKATG